MNQIKWECNSSTLEKFLNVLLAKFQVNNEISKVWPMSVSLMGKNARIPGQATEHKLKRGRRKLLESGYVQHSWIFQSPWWAEDFLMDYSLKKSGIVWVTCFTYILDSSNSSSIIFELVSLVLVLEVTELKWQLNW